MFRFYEDDREQVLTATWSLGKPVDVVSSDLPDEWERVLLRLGRDLPVRNFNGTIERIDWVAEYDPVSGCVLLLSDVTVRGRGPDGLGISGRTPRVDDDEESILAAIADLVQDQVARAHVAWPWGDDGGFMSPGLVDGRAVWAHHGQHTRIGDL